MNEAQNRSNERNTMQAITTQDKDIAQELVRAVANYQAEYSDENCEQMILVENLVCDHLQIGLDETEQGLTDNAIAQIEAFVSESIGKPWSYGGPIRMSAEDV